MTDEHGIDIHESMHDSGEIVPGLPTGAEVPGSVEADEAFEGPRDPDAYEHNLVDADDGEIVDAGDVEGDSDDLYQTHTATTEDDADPDFEDFDDAVDWGDDDPEEPDTTGIAALTAAELQADERTKAKLRRHPGLASDSQGEPATIGEARARQRIEEWHRQNDIADREALTNVPMSAEEAGKFMEAKVDLAEWAQYIQDGKVTEQQALEHGLSQDEYNGITSAMQPRSEAEKVIQDLESKHVDSVSGCWTGTEAELVRLTDLKTRNATVRLSNHPFFSEP